MAGGQSYAPILCDHNMYVLDGGTLMVKKYNFARITTRSAHMNTTFKRNSAVEASTIHSGVPNLNLLALSQKKVPICGI